MSLSKVLGVILIAASLIMAYTGFKKVTNSDTSFEIMGLKIDASNDSAKKEGYIYLAIASLVFIGGVYSVNKKTTQ